MACLAIVENHAWVSKIALDSCKNVVLSKINLTLHASVNIFFPSSKIASNFPSLAWYAYHKAP